MAGNMDEPDGFKDVREVQFQAGQQDTGCEAWKLLENLIEFAIINRSNEFAPRQKMPPEMWVQIVTLPPAIGRLKTVRKLEVYGSHLVRIPPEIGEMENLEELDIYTSYRLHWLPYEVTRCTKLKRSRASTRALYGNYKYRPPFPRLVCEESKTVPVPKYCSVCGQEFDPTKVRQVWISLRVATDVFPLLVNACSNECIGKLPKPAAGYVDYPHTGGLEVKQPAASFMRPPL